MNKKIIAMAASLLMLAGCASANTNTAEETTAAETTEVVTEAVTEATAEEIVDEEVEFVDEEIEEADYWTDEKIQEYVSNEYNLPSSTQVACFKQNGAALVAYADDNATSYIFYCKADGSAELLFEGNGPMGAVVECYNSDTFASYQNLENTLYIITDMVMGNGQPIKTWHLTADGNVTDLADTIDFEVENDGLYVFGTVIDGEEKTVIGLREQIPDTEAVGASQIVPVTLENEKIVKLDIVIDGEETAAEVIHEWENIDYSAELDIPESGYVNNDYTKSFRDYASDVIEDMAVIEYIEDSSDTLTSLILSGEDFYKYIACIYGDFDKDGEQEYLVGIDYGRSYRNNVAIVDNGEVVYWGTKENDVDVFSMVHVGEYIKADPYRLTGDNFDDYHKYIFTDYTTNDDNVFIASRLTGREALNYYFQINYDEEDGYSIECLRKVGWLTNNGEDEDGNIIGRQFVENPF